MFGIGQWKTTSSLKQALLEGASSLITRSPIYSYYIVLPLLLTLVVSGFYVVARPNNTKKSFPTPKPYSSQPYESAGLFHLALNQSDAYSPPTTEWLNMGYWKDTRDFPTACKALALRVLAHGRYNGGHVLDVGHGTGESLLLFLRERAIVRPQRLAGIVDLPSHYERSRRRVAQHMTTLDVPRIRRTATENNDTATTVELFLGDAVFRPGDTNIAAHPLDATRLEEPYDIVFGLDCVYHFQTRTKFLAQAHAALKPGGRIALADICFGPMPVFVRWLVTKLFVPSENVQTWADYGHTLDRLGYVNVEMEDITAEVYPSFVSFLKSRGVAWWIFGWVFRCLIVPYSRFVLVSAQKP